MKLQSMEQGRREIAGIDQKRAEIHETMSMVNGQVWEDLCDEDYKLRQTKRSIQSAMAELLKNNIKGGSNATRD